MIGASTLTPDNPAVRAALPVNGGANLPPMTEHKIANVAPTMRRIDADAVLVDVVAHNCHDRLVFDVRGGNVTGYWASRPTGPPTAPSW